MNENIFHIFHPDRDKNTRTVFVSAAQFGVKYGLSISQKGTIMQDGDKKKQLKVALDKIQKDHGAGAIMRLGDDETIAKLAVK